MSRYTANYEPKDPANPAAGLALVETREPVTVNRADLWELQVPVPAPGKRAAFIGGIVAAVVVVAFRSIDVEFEF